MDAEVKVFLSSGGLECVLASVVWGCLLSGWSGDGVLSGGAVLVCKHVALCVRESV